MSEPILMENTKTNTFSRFNPRVYKRNRRFYRKVPNGEITLTMLVSAGMGAEAIKSEPKPAAKPEPKPAAKPDGIIVDATIAGAPDMSGWSEDQLRDYAQDNDIPYHPMAKESGLRKAIQRHFAPAVADAKEDE